MASATTPPAAPPTAAARDTEGSSLLPAAPATGVATGGLGDNVAIRVPEADREGATDVEGVRDAVSTTGDAPCVLEPVRLALRLASDEESDAGAVRVPESVLEREADVEVAEPECVDD